MPGSGVTRAEQTVVSVTSFRDVCRGPSWAVRSLLFLPPPRGIAKGEGGAVRGV